MVALEGQTPTLFPRYVAACRKLGFSDTDLEFFHVHIAADAGHEHHGLEITSRYATTLELQQKAIAAVAASAGQRLAMLDGVWRALREPREEGSAPKRATSSGRTAGRGRTAAAGGGQRAPGGGRIAAPAAG